MVASTPEPVLSPDVASRYEAHRAQLQALADRLNATGARTTWNGKAFARIVKHPSDALTVRTYVPHPGSDPELADFDHARPAIFYGSPDWRLVGPYRIVKDARLVRGGAEWSVEERS